MARELRQATVGLLPLAVRPCRPRDRRNHRKWHLLLC